MLTKLRLKNFKNFKDAELHLGGFTVLLGTNAAGKSNICDALRLLYGLAAGYSVAEIFGGRYENGNLQWKGLRGWLSEIAFQGESTFSVEATYVLNASIAVRTGDSPLLVTYAIEINTGLIGDLGIIQPPSICAERIQLGNDNFLETSKPDNASDKLILKLWGVTVSTSNGENELIPNYHSLLTRTQHILKEKLFAGKDQLLLFSIMEPLRYEMLFMRDFDWNPVVMRDSVLPGYPVIGNRGEGLTSVLHSIFQHPNLKLAIVNWLQVLTPMDAVDLEFVPEESGKIALRIIEANGFKISAASASDGTLRFLAMLAAYFSAPPDSLYFLEELENGIHPTRLHLLLQLIEQQAQQGKVQTIATTHSPQLLRLLSEDSLKNASLIYRLDDRPDAQIQRLVDIPHFQDVLDGSDLGELLESGWLETTMSFQRDEVAIG
jgi:predicted ATPase